MSKIKQGPRPREYRDCSGGASVLCGRLDCSNCLRHRKEGFRDCIEDLLAVATYLSKGRDIPAGVTRILDHFDPTKNAHSHYVRPDVVAELAKKLEQGEPCARSR